jgi:hypothetical protein
MYATLYCVKGRGIVAEVDQPDRRFEVGEMILLRVTVTGIEMFDGGFGARQAGLVLSAKASIEPKEPK